MKGFSLKNWIEDSRAAYVNNLGSYDNDNKFLNNDLGDLIKGNKDLNDLSKEEVKKLKMQFFDVQEKIHVEYLIPEENSAFDIMKNVDPSKHKVPNEYEIVKLLSAFVAGYNLANQDFKNNAVLCNQIINTYVNDGYNFYPLLEKLNERANQLVDGADSYLSKDRRDFEFQVSNVGAKLLQNAQKLSPYNQVFDITDKIGKLLEQQEDEISEERQKSMQGNIDALKQQLDVAIADFDPDFLRQIAVDRIPNLVEWERFYDYGLSALQESIANYEASLESVENKQLSNTVDNVK